MKQLHEIKKEREDKQSELFKECGVFFAFSNEQFSEGKTTLEEGDKYVSMGMGGYLPKSKVAAFNAGWKELAKWYKKEVADNKKLRREEIVYELGNHEAWYTGDIEDTMCALGPDYTRKEVWKIFNSEKEKQMSLRD